MKIAKTIEYAASPTEVFEVLSDTTFQEEKCAATAATDYNATVETSGDRTVITTERTLPSSGLPDFAKSLVGDSLKVTETQDWGPPSDDGSRQGTIEMSVAGTPLTLRGTLSLAPGGTGTIEVVDADLKAKVPLIGGKVEKAAAPPIESGIAIERKTATKWLAR